MGKMPKETHDAVAWAVKQDGVLIEEFGTREIFNNALVDKVREYFTVRGIECALMSYDDLVPYLPQQ